MAALGNTAESVTPIQPLLRDLTACVVINTRSESAHGKQDEEAQRDRFLRDVDHFTAKLRANPNDTRSAYYLAQSLKDAGLEYDALDAYERRARMGGNPDEAQVAMLQVARFRKHLLAPSESVEAAYWRAIAHSPTRLCGLVELANWHNDRGEFSQALTWASQACAIKKPGGRFLTRPDYREWFRYFELYRAQIKLNLPECEATAQKLFRIKSLPDWERQYVAQTQHERAKEQVALSTEARGDGGA